MAARRKQSSLLVPLALSALAVVVAVFLLDSKFAPKFAPKVANMVKQTAVPTTVQKQTTATVGAVNGPVGRNALRAYAGPGVGEITLEWQRYFLDGENFNVLYGTGSNNYSTSLSHVGYISTYRVNGLTPGTKYYFAVEGIRTGDVSAGHDGEVSMIAPKTPVEVDVEGPVGRNSMVAKTGVKTGTVDLSWKRFFNDTQLYNVVYGEEPGSFIYGVLDAKDTTPADIGNYTYTVGGLKSGKRYYFALVPQRNGQGIYTSAEVSAIAR